jgi:hypothetical protein
MGTHLHTPIGKAGIVKSRISGDAVFVAADNLLIAYREQDFGEQV